MKHNSVRTNNKYYKAGVYALLNNLTDLSAKEGNDTSNFNDNSRPLECSLILKAILLATSKSATFIPKTTYKLIYLVQKEKHNMSRYAFGTSDSINTHLIT